MTSMEPGETTTRRIRSAARMSTSSKVDGQPTRCEADAAQIGNGHSDTGSGGDVADADDGVDACRTRCRDSGGRVLEHRATFGRYLQALRGEQVGVGEGFPVFDVFACDQDVCRDQAGRRHACGGDGTPAGRHDRPAAPRTGFQELACARYRCHVGGVVQLLLRQVSGRGGDIAWRAY